MTSNQYMLVVCKYRQFGLFGSCIECFITHGWDPLEWLDDMNIMSGGTIYESILFAKDLNEEEALSISNLKLYRHWSLENEV